MATPSDDRIPAGTSLFLDFIRAGAALGVVIAHAGNTGLILRIIAVVAIAHLLGSLLEPARKGWSRVIETVLNRLSPAGSRPSPGSRLGAGLAG